MSKNMSKGSGGMKAGEQNKGLRNMSPSSSDASTNLKMSPSVNEGATRSGTAETPATLGPRNA